MTELERVLLAKLEQIEQRHEQQTEDLRLQLQQQAHSCIFRPIMNTDSGST
ncbi:hypothetical protein ACLH4B_004325 [Aeromonas salmonicida]